MELGRGNCGLCLLVSGSVWSSYRKSCVNMVMKWLIPESSYINRMTNEALHKGERTRVRVPPAPGRSSWFRTLLLLCGSRKGPARVPGA